MKRKNSFMEEMQAAYDESNGQWQALEAKFEFPGVTEEMFIWFHANLDDELYRMWCPGSHRSYRKLTYSDIRGEVVEEATVPPYGPDTVILRHPPIEDTPFAGKLKVPAERASYTEAIDLNGRVSCKILHERYPYPDRLVLINSYLLPKALCPELVQGFMAHQHAEYHFDEFLPELYSKRTWMVQK